MSRYCGLNDSMVTARSDGDDGNPQVVKKLHGIVFCPMMAALEGEVIVPGAGEEGILLPDNMAYFQEQVDVHIDSGIRDIKLKEINEREGLKRLVE